MHITNYPNLELLEYKFRQQVFQKYKTTLRDAKYPIFSVDTFRQTWTDSSLGFTDGRACLDSFTDEYTSVFKMRWYINYEGKLIMPEKEIYGVFFGDELAYTIEEPSDVFFSDLEKRQMKNQTEAKEEY